MPISDGEWVSIRALVQSFVNAGRPSFTTGKVIKRDESNKLVWLAEFGDQPIPLIAFDYTVDTYDTDTAGTVQRRTQKIEVLTPEIGDVVIVARELGSNTLPRCLGILKGQNWIDPSED